MDLLSDSSEEDEKPTKAVKPIKKNATGKQVATESEQEFSINRKFAARFEQEYRKKGVEQERLYTYNILY